MLRIQRVRQILFYVFSVYLIELLELRLLQAPNVGMARPGDDGRRARYCA